jgi:hypothetical protein
LLVEELDAAESDGRSGPGNLLLVSQVEKVLAQVLIAELVGPALIMLGQLPDGPGVSLLSSCGKSAQLHILKHPLL